MLFGSWLLSVQIVYLHGGTYMYVSRHHFWLLIYVPNWQSQIRSVRQSVTTVDKYYHIETSMESIKGQDPNHFEEDGMSLIVQNEIYLQIYQWRTFSITVDWVEVLKRKTGRRTMLLLLTVCLMFCLLVCGSGQLPLTIRTRRSAVRGYLHERNCWLVRVS